MANENRLDLISRQALLDEYDRVHIGPPGGARKLMEDAPTVDAVEVVHAYWTGSRFNPMTDEYEEYCSHCCAWSSEYDKPYCPNCGAKMDGGNEDG